jgi:hypothetical protein
VLITTAQNEDDKEKKKKKRRSTMASNLTKRMRPMMTEWIAKAPSPASPVEAIPQLL